MNHSSGKQRTLGSTVRCSGVGLHTGKMVQMTLSPSAVNSGIIFIRSDIDNGEGARAQVAATYHAVTDTMLGTTVENMYGTKVSTIEHLMAALWGLGVDNAIIEISGPEVPIMDGSSDPFVFLVECAGVVEQTEARRVLKIDRTITVTEGDSTITVMPHDGFVLDVEIAFNHAAIARQQAEYDFSQVTFRQMLSRARTFGFERDVERLQAIGLARGGSLNNAIVIGDDRVLNEDGLRYEDEFVRHKALDCVGDFFLAGMRIEGRIIAYKPGHGINNKLLKTIFSQKDAWHIKDGLALVSNNEDVITRPTASRMISGVSALAGAAMLPAKW